MYFYWDDLFFDSYNWPLFDWCIKIDVTAQHQYL
jgi:hypothetical protein